MGTITIILASLVSLEHVYIMYLETVATTSGHTAKTFGLQPGILQAKEARALLKNQGIYNLLLAVLLAIAVVLGDTLWLRLLLGYVILVAAYGSLTSNKMIIMKQGGPATLALICSFLGI
ncbi:DUF1304 domain-containing protein [Prevotella sp. KH2C16]|uniref:DUF1304 domain-containing protein n=1 Tax=Prevotella sp. KH2C16 TaxID=1855325 RepID=UPI0008E8A5DC|nr:DUF1304 family protein [Prevotella sp. KH2C16]SFG62488.1 putative membrane protein [Prevotella sp. KH2C16]